MQKLYDIDNGIIGIFAYVTPEQFGAVGDGVTDDTDAIQDALNNCGCIIFDSSKIYKITSAINIHADTIIDLNGSILNYTTTDGSRMFVNFTQNDTDFTEYNGNGNIIIRNGTVVGGNISFAHGENILIENVKFKNGHSPHFLEICACKNYIVRNCSFIGVSDSAISIYEYINIDPAVYRAFPLLPDGSVFFDNTMNDGVIIQDCYFSLGESAYAYGYNAVGVHVPWGVGTHKKIRIVGNVMKGFTGCGLRINNMDDVSIINNYIDVAGDGIKVGDVAQSTNIIIKANIISATGTAITKENSSTVFQSADNDINPTFS